jgi:hypothetical protein
MFENYVPNTNTQDTFNPCEVQSEVQTVKSLVI